MLRKLWRGYFANENYGGVICYEKIAVQKYQEIEHREKIVQQYEGLMTITKNNVQKRWRISDHKKNPCTKIYIDGHKK